MFIALALSLLIHAGATMAKPPEPLQEVLPRATLIVDAEVVKVLATGPQPPAPEHRPGATSTGGRTPWQTVKLRIKRVLRGKATGDIEVRKPEGDYMLVKGNKGPFLVGDGVILGRYGPDTWRMDAIEAALGSPDPASHQVDRQPAR